MGTYGVTDKNIPANDRLIYAMDVPDCAEARSLAEDLGDSVRFYKLCLEPMIILLMAARS